MQQIVFADHPVAVLHEKNEQIEGLWFEVDQFGAAPQFAADDVEPMITKRQNHARHPEICPISIFEIVSPP